MLALFALKTGYPLLIRQHVFVSLASMKKTIHVCNAHYPTVLSAYLKNPVLNAMKTITGLSTSQTTIAFAKKDLGRTKIDVFNAQQDVSLAIAIAHAWNATVLEILILFLMMMDNAIV